MHGYHVALAAVAILIGILARKTPRAWVWISALATSFVVSVTYLYSPHVFGIPQPGVAMMCDACVFLMVREIGRDRWELYGLCGLLMVSITINLVQTAAHIAGFPPRLPDDVYGIILEAINYMALLLIGGVGLLDRIGSSNAWVFLSGSFGRTLGRIGDFAHLPTNQKTPFKNW